VLSLLLSVTAEDAMLAYSHFCKEKDWWHALFSQALCGGIGMKSLLQKGRRIIAKKVVKINQKC
jgi:hypothetical protein